MTFDERLTRIEADMRDPLTHDHWIQTAYPLTALRIALEAHECDSPDKAEITRRAREIARGVRMR